MHVDLGYSLSSVKVYYQFLIIMYLFPTSSFIVSSSWLAVWEWAMALHYPPSLTATGALH